MNKYLARSNKSPDGGEATKKRKSCGFRHAEEGELIAERPIVQRDKKMRAKMTDVCHKAIQSIGPPPERHADRVVAEMMRHLARKRATLLEAINEAIANSTDGGPRAQRKMAERIERAGALNTELTSGKRGRYTLTFCDFTGWDAKRDAEIRLGDKIPEKPWIACNVTILSSPGRGRETLDCRSTPVILITHHAMSRTAQRLGLRTTEHLMVAARTIWNGAVKLLNDKENKAWLDAPPQGWRVPIEAKGEAFVILKRHDKHDRVLVAATVF